MTNGEREQTLSGPRPLPGIGQVGIVVHDLDRAVADYGTIFGIATWYTFKVQGSAKPGEPGYFTTRISLGQLGSIQIELVQPLDGSCLYHDHLSMKGEGLHHLGVFVEDFDGWLAALRVQGMQVLYSRRSEHGTSIAYLQGPKSAGTIFELIKADTAFRAQLASVKLRPERSHPPSVPFEYLDHVCIVVNDLDRTIAGFADLGIGPWRYLHHSPASSVPTRSGSEKARLSVAFAQMGPLRLEVFQPVDDSSIYWEHLATRGEGLHHLGFVVKNFEGCLQALGEQGIRVVQGSPDRPPKYVCTDATRTAGVILEFSDRTLS